MGETGKCLRTLHLDGGGGRVSSLHFSYDGSMLACAADVLYLFNVSKGDCLAKLSNDRNSKVLDCAWSLSGSSIVAVEGAASKVWELDLSKRGVVNGTVGRVHRSEKMHKAHGCCFTNGGGVVSVGASSKVFLFSGSAPSAPGRRRPSTQSNTSVIPSVLGEHDGHVYRCCASACGRFLLTVSSDKRPAVWNLENNSCCCRLLGHTGITKAGDFYQVDGAASEHDILLVATGADDQTARIWDPLDSGRCLGVIHVGVPVLGVSWLPRPSSPLLPWLCVLTSGGVRLWEVAIE